MLAIVATALILLFLTTPAIAAQAIRVVDGDTIASARVEMRVLGLDAPEIFHYQCPAEKALGLQAKAVMVGLLSPPHQVRIVRSRDRRGHIKHDKYGRVLARVYSDGKDVAPIMIAQGLAHPYSGVGPRQGWCAPTMRRRSR